MQTLTTQSKNDLKDDMRVFSITVPYVSNGLRRTYNKQLEVRELILHSTSNKDRFHSTQTHLHKIVRGKWVQKEIMKPAEHFYSPEKIYDELIIPGAMRNSTSQTIYLNNLELAKSQKIVFIDAMAREYQKSIDELLAAMKKNVPDVSDQMHSVKMAYPEMFL